MKADFSRLLFNLDSGYTRVLQQQGRVTLDADWNEQVTLQAELDRKRLSDLVGICGVPQENPGFAIIPDADGLGITAGVIYVHGLRLQNDEPVLYDDGSGDDESEGGSHGQPFLPDPDPLTDPATAERIDLVYLCAKERHITYLEDERIREVALGGPDTTTRVQTIWHVLVNEGVSVEEETPGHNHCEEDFSDRMPAPLGGGRLTTVVSTVGVNEDPCVTPAGSGYRGLENRLYRVEVHQGGPIGAEASIKWSRYNGAIAFRVVADSINVAQRRLELTRLGWDQIRTLKPGDWIELVSVRDELNGNPGAMIQIDTNPDAVDEARRQITISEATAGALSVYQNEADVKVRLWDGGVGEIRLTDLLAAGDPQSTQPIELEDGISITLSVESVDAQLRSGDYWTFRARINADEAGNTIDLLYDSPPHGPMLHCCKLALIHWNDPEEGTFVEDCRPIFPPLTEVLNLYYVSGDGQEALPGNPLPRPLMVRVNRGEHPVENVPIHFELQTPGNGAELLRYDSDRHDPQDPTSVTITAAPNPVYTDARGLAAVIWRVGSDRDVHSHQVLAYIESPDGAREHLQVRFNANLSLAEQVSYQPPDGCDILAGATNVAEALNELCSINADQVTYEPPDDCTNLADTTNVAEALDALCNISGEEDPGFHVTGIFWVVPDASGNREARHDGLVTVDRFLRGFCVECDASPDIRSVKHASFYFQLELPLGGGPFSAVLSEYTIPGLLDVRGAEQQRICWQPAPAASAELRTYFAATDSDEPILARLTIKGSHIWQANRPDIFLDGEVTSDVTRTDFRLDLPSGDGKAGGDFETWFNITPSPVVEPPVGELRWVVDGVTFPTTLDPILVTEPQDITAINLLFAGLVRLGADGQVLPDLAESFEVSDDGTLYTFKLRESLTFPDGNTLRADAVLFSLERAIDAGSSATGPIYLSNIASMEPVDDLTVVIGLRQPSRFFLQQLTTPPAKIVSPAAVEAGSVAEITSGAFGLDGDDQRVLSLVRNPGYWAPAGVESIELIYADGRGDAIAIYEAGDADVVGTIQTGLPDSASNLADFIGGDDFCAVRYLNFIRHDDNVLQFDDQRFYQAISHAINRQQLVDMIGEKAIPANRLLPPCIDGVPDPDTSLLEFDRDTADALLDEMGWVDQNGDGLREDDQGITVQLRGLFTPEGNGVNDLVMQQIQEDLLNIGILFSPQQIDLRAFSKMLHQMATDPSRAAVAQFHLYFSIWTADYQDPQNMLSQQLHSVQIPSTPFLNNNGHYNDEEFDGHAESGDKGMVNFGLDYQRAERRALETGGWIPLYYPQPRALIRTSGDSAVEGLKLTGRGIVVTAFPELRVRS